MKHAAVFILAVTLLTSCSQRMIETSLYFGQSRPDGTKVTDAEW